MAQNQEKEGERTRGGGSGGEGGGEEKENIEGGGGGWPRREDKGCEHAFKLLSLLEWERWWLMAECLRHTTFKGQNQPRTNWGERAKRRRCATAGVNNACKRKVSERQMAVDRKRHKQKERKLIYRHKHTDRQTHKHIDRQTDTHSLTPQHDWSGWNKERKKKKRREKEK